MNNNKQSSIEIFYEEVCTSFASKLSWSDLEKLNNLKKQAKAMHKEEIIDAGSYQYYLTAEQYYEHTFGGNNEQQ